MKNLTDKETAAPAAQTSRGTAAPNLAAEQPNLDGSAAPTSPRSGAKECDNET